MCSGVEVMQEVTEGGRVPVQAALPPPWVETEPAYTDGPNRLTES